MKDVAAFNKKEEEGTEGALVEVGDASKDTKGGWDGGWDGGAGWIFFE